mmetsp:Transcript_1474/g.1824  ORF Transcript_1474/g.1824 Transcript_1474/m.1824 type:complete len:82 (+) Transcript_1474:705-950(+)
MNTGSPPSGVAPKHGTVGFTVISSFSAFREVEVDFEDGEVKAAADARRRERIGSFMVDVRMNKKCCTDENYCLLFREEERR